MAHKQSVIGRNAHVEFVDFAQSAPAKVDTGADSSSVWATNIHVDADHQLHFVLFGEGSAWYTGKEIIVSDYSVAQVRSSSGHAQIRYKVPLLVRIAERRIKALFTLADRQKNKFPILVGRRTLKGKFVVDVSQAEHKKIDSRPREKGLNEELRENPYMFHKKYHQSNTGSGKVVES